MHCDPPNYHYYQMTILISPYILHSEKTNIGNTANNSEKCFRRNEDRPSRKPCVSACLYGRDLLLAQQQDRACKCLRVQTTRKGTGSDKYCLHNKVRPLYRHRRYEHLRKRSLVFVFYDLRPLPKMQFLTVKSLHIASSVVL